MEQRATRARIKEMLSTKGRDNEQTIFARGSTISMGRDVLSGVQMREEEEGREERGSLWLGP